MYWDDNDLADMNERRVVEDTTIEGCSDYPCSGSLVTKHVRGFALAWRKSSIVAVVESLLIGGGGILHEKEQDFRIDPLLDEMEGSLAIRRTGERRIRYAASSVHCQIRIGVRRANYGWFLESIVGLEATYYGNLSCKGMLLDIL